MEHFTYDPRIHAGIVEKDGLLVPLGDIQTVKLPDELGGIHVPVSHIDTQSNGCNVIYLHHDSPNAVINIGQQLCWVQIPMEEDE
tara:strand:- start:537 stop:791 length:255 start_codon:yes stop_codon:yes gene_type:complete